VGARLDPPIMATTTPPHVIHFVCTCAPELLALQVRQSPSGLFFRLLTFRLPAQVQRESRSGDGDALQTVETGEGDDLGEGAVGFDAETVDAPVGADFDVEEPVLGTY
jgi:hypothetical protein